MFLLFSIWFYNLHLKLNIVKLAFKMPIQLVWKLMKTFDTFKEFLLWKEMNIQYKEKGKNYVQCQICRRFSIHTMARYYAEFNNKSCCQISQCPRRYRIDQCTILHNLL